MKAVLLFLISSIYLVGIYAQDNVFGVWKAIDDEDGEATSHIEVFENDGKAYGKILKVLSGPSDALCGQCKGEKHNQPIEGMEIIWGMESKGDKWKGGRIMDPENGKVYQCKMHVRNGVLEVRGYIGVPALGRTQKWYRLK